MRRIFALHLAGSGTKEIAHTLNAEGLAPPRPRALSKLRPSWSPSAIHEMLRNSLYAGERVFNRSDWIKDHETGRRKRYERPPSEWVREERPDLVVIDRATFDAVQAEIRRRAGASPNREVYLRPGRFAGSVRGNGHGPARHALSGVLACGVCGGAFYATNGAGRYGCGWHRGRGPSVCASTLVVQRITLEERVFGAIRERILVPDVVAYAVEQALAILRREEVSKPEQVDAARTARLAEIDTEIDVLRKMAERPGRSGNIGPLLASLVAERASVAGPASLGFLEAVEFESLRPTIEAHMAEMSAAFAGAPEAKPCGLPFAARQSPPAGACGP